MAEKLVPEISLKDYNAIDKKLIFKVVCPKLSQELLHIDHYLERKMLEDQNTFFEQYGITDAKRFPTNQGGVVTRFQITEDAYQKTHDNKLLWELSKIKLPSGEIEEWYYPNPELKEGQEISRKVHDFLSKQGNHIVQLMEREEKIMGFKQKIVHKKFNLLPGQHNVVSKVYRAEMDVIGDEVYIFYPNPVYESYIGDDVTGTAILSEGRLQFTQNMLNGAIQNRLGKELMQISQAEYDQLCEKREQMNREAELIAMLPSVRRKKEGLKHG